MNTMSPIRPLARTSRIVNESRSVRRQLHANARPADAVHAAAHPALQSPPLWRVPAASTRLYDSSSACTWGIASPIQAENQSSNRHHPDSNHERVRQEQTADVHRLRRPGLSLLVHRLVRPGLSLLILPMRQPHVAAPTLRVTSARSKTHDQRHAEADDSDDYTIRRRVTRKIRHE